MVLKEVQTRSVKFFPIIAFMAFALEALAVPLCFRFGHAGKYAVSFWGGLGLLLSLVCVLIVHRNVVLHIFFALCALYWLSGYFFFYTHSTSGSYVVLHARPTGVNKCIATFYRPWFAVCFHLPFDKDPVSWNA